MSKRLNLAPSLPARQQGIVLFIALIVLVAMTLAGIAIVRSVDTGNLVSGNIAFRQAALASGDRGLDDAFTWLKNNLTTGVLDADSASDGYFAVVTEPPPTNPGGPPDWTAASVWASAKTVGTDSNGNTVSYVIHRMCSSAGPYNQVGTACAQTPRTGGAAGNGQGVGDNQFNANPVVYFRVTVRVTGPRSTLAVLQSNVGLQM
jgi:Tfp pilus assembly protein PilX